MLLKHASRAGSEVSGAQVLKAAANSAHGLLSLAAHTTPDAACSTNNGSSGCSARAYSSNADNWGNGYSMGGNGEPRNKSRRGRGAGRVDSNVAIARELRKQCEVSAQEAVEQHMARMVMADPLAQLMASRGMPLGISMRHSRSAPNYTSNVPSVADVVETSQAHYFMKHSMEAVEQVFRKASRNIDSARSDRGNAGNAYSEDQYSDAHNAASVADVAVEVEVEQPMVVEEGQPGAMQAGPYETADGAAQTVSHQAAGEGPYEGSRGFSSVGGIGGSGEGSEGGHGRGGKGAGEWDADTVTTMASSAEIAQKIADSNAGLARMVAEADAAQAGPPQQMSAEEDEDLKLGPEDTKYKTLEQMSADIKGLDEVFELLASVPWLDEDDVKQKELKGMAMVSLLGTLEDVGFNIRPYVERIWAGESDDGMVQTCTEAKDQAAVLSILFHTRKIVEEYGVPPRR